MNENQERDWADDLDDDEDLEPTVVSGKRAVPRSTWVWLGGIILTLLTLLGMIWTFEGKTKTANADVVSEEAGDALVIPAAPVAGDVGMAVEPSPEEASVPLPPLPPPMPANIPSYAPPPSYSPPPAYEPPPVAPRALSLRERRMGMTISPESTAAETPEDRYLQRMSAIQGTAAPPAAQTAPSRSPDGGAAMLNAPDYQLTQGTFLPCALETAISTDADGPVSCTVTRTVHSFTGAHVLIPRGTRIFGEYAGSNVRRARVSIVWTRLLTPQGISVQMRNPAMDGQGANGVSGSRNSHWASRISSAMMISLLSDGFKYWAAKNGPRTTTSYGMGNVVEEPFQSNTAEAIQELSRQAIQASSESRPTVSVPAGALINVYVAQDVDFSNVLGR